MIVYSRQYLGGEPGTNMLVAQSLNGCLHFLIPQSINNWIKERSDDRVQHRQKFIYRVTIKWDTIDEDGRAKEESDDSDVSRQCGQSLRGCTGGVLPDGEQHGHVRYEQENEADQGKSPLFTITKSSRM